MSTFIHLRSQDVLGDGAARSGTVNGSKAGIYHPVKAYNRSIDALCVLVPAQGYLG